MRPASFRETVNLRGKPCCWTRHFRDGCARAVIGYLQKLSRNDRERFVWPSFGDIARHAFNWHNDPDGSSLYADRQVRRALRLLEATGAILPMHMTRNRREHFGWVVTEHATPPERERCELPNSLPTYRSAQAIRRVSAANVSGPKLNVSGFVSGPKGFVSGKTSECVRECVRSFEPQTPGVREVNAGGREDLSPVSRTLAFYEPSKPLIFHSEERMKKEEGEPVIFDDLPLSPSHNLKGKEPGKAKAKLLN